MSFISLDIGSNSIKIVQLGKKDNKFRLISVGQIATPNLGMASEAEHDLVVIAEAIKKLRTESKIAPIQVVVSLPESFVFTRVIDLPAMSEEEIGQALKWELEEIVPIPLNEANFDWQIVGQELTKVSVLVAVAPNTLISKYLHVLELAQLQPIVFETEVLAVCRALNFISPGESKLLVDIGARSTNIIALSGKEVVLTRSIPTAGQALSRAVANGLGLDPEVAEEYKKTYGILPDQLEGKVAETITPILEVIESEIIKTINFVKEKQKGSIEMIVLSGGSSNLPGLSGEITKKIGLEVQLANPFSQLTYDQSLTPQLMKLAPAFVVAVGLAMREG